MKPLRQLPAQVDLPALERSVLEGRGLDGGREVEDLRLLGGREVVVGEEVPHQAPPLSSARAPATIPANAAAKASTSDSEMTSGGTKRSVEGPVALSR